MAARLRCIDSDLGTCIEALFEQLRIQIEPDVDLFQCFSCTKYTTVLRTFPMRKQGTSSMDMVNGFSYLDDELMPSNVVSIHLCLIPNQPDFYPVHV